LVASVGDMTQHSIVTEFFDRYREALMARDE
jgi:hypothetical protein